MEEARLNLGSLYGGGTTTIKTEKKTKASQSKKTYAPNKKNSFSRYDAKEENEKDKSSESEQWRKQNRILQAELNDIKKSLEQMKRTNAELKRELELLQQ